MAFVLFIDQSVACVLYTNNRLSSTVWLWVLEIQTANNSRKASNLQSWFAYNFSPSCPSTLSESRLFELCIVTESRHFNPEKKASKNSLEITAQPGYNDTIVTDNKFW